MRSAGAARFARGRDVKTAQLEEALREFYTTHPRGGPAHEMFSQHPHRISAQIAALDARIEEQIGPSAEAGAASLRSPVSTPWPLPS